MDYMSSDNEINPLQKYLDAFDKQEVYVPPTFNPSEAQYLLKALDYLQIWSNDNQNVVEQPIHQKLEEKLTDIILDAPET